MAQIAPALAEAQGLICDLDGTLVDTAEGIWDSLSYAITGRGGDIRGYSHRQLIGPPLDDIVRHVLPSASADTVAEVITLYKQYYDSMGFRAAVVYDGVHEMLRSARSRGVSVYVLTNKRYAPTMQILSHFGLNQYIAAVAAMDAPGWTSTDRPAGKVDRAVQLVAAERISDRIFVGDSEDDLLAAKKVGGKFFLAGWGYGAANVVEHYPDVMVLEGARQMIAVIDQL